ncbi:Mut7-C RNAse domain-containing protein [Haloterrigena salinisoli]|uniref:Mut7-C RNAse domain-containing protein n=1 Tax=Haloterrigena salinisoli TaxID=3132747 RepID=UPI0030CEB6F4
MRLLLDVMCGGLDAYLRMCDHDTVYAGDRGLEADDALLALARDEDRTLLTRDVALAARAADSILLESRDVEEQLAELADAGIDLTLADEPRFCGRCNGRLERVDSTASTPEYAPDSTETDVWRCRDCDQHFWQGSHWDRVERTLSEIDGSDGNPDDGG